jgi:hypothetical protein
MWRPTARTRCGSTGGPPCACDGTAHTGQAREEGEGGHEKQQRDATTTTTRLLERLHDDVPHDRARAFLGLALPLAPEDARARTDGRSS